MTITETKNNTGIIIGVIVALLIAAIIYFTAAQTNVETTSTGNTVITETMPPIVDTTDTAATPPTANEEVTGTNAPINEVPAGTTDTMGTTGAKGSLDNRDTVGTSQTTTP